MNGKLTEKEFMEHYHFLMLNLFFFSKQCQGTLPEGEYNLTKNVREMTLHDLDSSNDYPGGKFLMRLLLKNTSDQRHQHKVFEFFLTDNVKSLLVENNPGKEKRQLFLWLDTEIACRRIAFYERVLSDKKTVEDERFITIFSTLKYGGDSNVQGWDNSCISELLKLEVNVRSFVDQVPIFLY